MYIPKRIIAIILALVALQFILFVSVVVYNAVQSNRWFNDFKEEFYTERYWGSFTDAIVTSSDNFQGICWEEGTHNIWIQSSDTGINCYANTGTQWIPDEDAVRPDGIAAYQN